MKKEKYLLIFSFIDSSLVVLTNRGYRILQAIDRQHLGFCSVLH